MGLVRACLVSQRVGDFEQDFADNKEKVRRRAGARQGFLTQLLRKICRKNMRGEMLNRL